MFAETARGLSHLFVDQEYMLHYWKLEKIIQISFIMTMEQNLRAIVSAWNLWPQGHYTHPPHQATTLLPSKPLRSQISLAVVVWVLYSYQFCLMKTWRRTYLEVRCISISRRESSRLSKTTCVSFGSSSATIFPPFSLISLEIWSKLSISMFDITSLAWAINKLTFWRYPARTSFSRACHFPVHYLGYRGKSN